MRVEKGTYPLKKRHLSLNLPNGLELDETPTCLYLTGVNGLGKTSFIEKVLIPALKAQHVPFMYLGQDFRTQLYTLKAALAVIAKQDVPNTILEVLTAWVAQNRDSKFLILDEFDKYAAHTEHLFQITRDFIRTYVIVSHANQPLDPGESFRKRFLVFRQSAATELFLRVTVEESVSWPS